MQEHFLKSKKPGDAKRNWARFYCVSNPSGPDLAEITQDEFSALLTGFVPQSIFYRDTKPIEGNCGVIVRTRWTYFLLDRGVMVGSGLAMRFSRWNTEGSPAITNRSSAFYRFDQCKHEWQDVDVLGDASRRTCLKCKRSYLKGEADQ